jgi:uncharacterized OB-fold protein
MAEPLVQIPIEPENEAFFEYASRGELRIQSCAACDRMRFPPRPICPWCLSVRSNWRLVSGRGRIWSFVVPHPPLLPPFSDLARYNVVVVELEEDQLIRLVGNVVLDGNSEPLRFVDPAELKIGSPVQATFPAVSWEPTLPRWLLVR